ncbi:MAG: helix-turn-helix domain-containing protein, partial [Halobacteriaceae archaeon]
ISQTALASELDISSSVISDYESGRRDNPGVRIIRRLVQGLLTLDEQRGGERIRQYVRIHSAGFESDVVLDLQEYTTPLALNEFYDLLDATEVQEGKHSHINGHTVINSIEAITSLSSDEFYRLYGRSTSRALVFTDVSRGESPLVALRVVIPTPNAVLLHGINQSELWEFAPLLAQKDGYSLA